MVSWTCPHCGTSMYSAYNNSSEPTIECITCLKEFDNEYFEDN